MPDSDTKIRLTGARERTPRSFDLRPDAQTCSLLAQELDLTALRKLRLAGELRPTGTRDWELEATLGATIVQPCGVTLEPVTTRVEESVDRRYLAAYDEELAAEQEMPDETADEPLPSVLDLMALLTEELILAIPPYPRAEGTAPVEAESLPKGAEPIRDDDLKPFAGLKDALDKGQN